MPEKLVDSTEEKIKEAAEAIFLCKGLKGTRIREVAEKASVNVALVNYYFRSKNNLFLSIFKEKFRTYSVAISQIMSDQHLSIWQRVEACIDHYLELFKAQPNLPIFIMSELHYNEELATEIAEIKKRTIEEYHTDIQASLDEAARNGEIRQLLVRDLDFTIISMLISPFLSRKMIMRIDAFTEEDFERFLEAWSGQVKDMLKAYLKP